MRFKILALVFLLNSSITGSTQTLYIKTFGLASSPPVIFLHGGPGYNAANFEATTAQKLADNGFFVIVYDRRGEGRSADPAAAFTFEETNKDLNNIYTSFKLKKASLIGHSFGGVVAVKFAEKNRDKVSNIFLVGAPVSLQETFKTIIKSCKKIYTEKKDSTNLKYISMLETMNNETLEYGSYCFGHAMANGFYTPKVQTPEAKEIYAKMRNDTLLKHMTKMTFPGPQGFWNNERYTLLNLEKGIKELKSKGVNIYGLYGKEDGLYSPEQVSGLQTIIGNANLKYYDNCSHNVFIDQQSEFISSLKAWSKS